MERTSKPEFQTIIKEQKKYGNRNVIEIAKKKVISENGETEIISISKGFVAHDGSIRFKRGNSVGFENRDGAWDFLANALQKVISGSEQAEDQTQEQPQE